ncbi:RcnB family protein [Sphingomonas sp. IC4-52]|uniref:RcnB family protein n=1 Tax=Sphingomonas sp. IC4-52 TaxID=2887202 RepID=UPI001D12EC51|nr:RcnB family protein [Sphingomonas sp. IC4-52]MCC2981683.1 RcnB family protein [Sphingomonas sp. IC4-52]
MNRFLIAALATTMVATPTLAAAQPYRGPAHNSAHTVVQQRGHGPVVVKQNTRYRAPAVQYRSNWRKGERFDSRQARNYRQIDYRQYRGLKAPPRGYHYVQSGNDAVLVGITSGIVAAVFASLIR